VEFAACPGAARSGARGGESAASEAHTFRSVPATSNPASAMKHRNPLLVLFLPFFTLGIYHLVWYVKTKNEMNKLGATVPTAWLLIIPFANIYWVWVYGVGVAQVTKGAHSALGSFLLRFFFGPIGCAITQYEFNRAGAA